MKTDNLLTGYHYTARRMWYKIRKQGLKPYPIRHHPELNAYFPGGANGIWVWIKPHRGRMELSSILWHVAMKQTVHVIKLKVEYFSEDCLSHKGRRVVLPHYGQFGDFVGHDGRQEAHIVVVPIPVKNITLLAEYNLLDLVNK